MRAAETLRREGFAGTITLVGAETHWPPVDRPPLSKQLLAGTWDLDRSRLRTTLDPANDGRLDLRLGRRAVDADVATGELTLDDGATVGFDGLVVATGGTPRRLPRVGDLAGTHLLRTVDDSLALRTDLERGARLAVVGAGFIGCEVAVAARHFGCQVDVVEALPLPLVRVLGEQVGQMAADLHRENGVTLHLGVGVEAIEGDDRVTGVRLTTGALIEADALVVGIGVTPATEWLAGTDLVIDNGVSCDETLAAHGAANVVAAGDVARWPNPAFGGAVMRIEHWTNAAEQGEHAAITLLRSLAGGTPEPEPFVSVPYFWSDQYGVRLQMLGVWAEHDDVHVAEGDPLAGERRGVLAFVRDGVVTGALCVNRASRTLKWRKAIAERATWPLPSE